MATIVVTGGAQGIGRAMALAFAEHEAAAPGVGGEPPAVIVADVDAEAAAEACELIERRGARAEFVRCDVSDEADVEALAAAVRRRLDGGGAGAGRALRHLLINAGVEGERAPVGACPTEAFDRVLAVNVRGAFLAAKHLSPMVAAGGAVAFTGSTAGVRGMAEFAAYSASKHAVHGLALSLARELAPAGVRVNVVAPATTDTPMVARFTARWPEWQAEANRAYPLGRIASADEVAQAALFLCTRGSFCAGTVLTVDGGAGC